MCSSLGIVAAHMKWPQVRGGLRRVMDMATGGFSARSLLGKLWPDVRVPSGLQRDSGRDHIDAKRFANRVVGQLAVMDIEAVQKVRIILACLLQPLSARARRNGSVALPKAWVDVRATAPGMLATQ